MLYYFLFMLQVYKTTRIVCAALADTMRENVSHVIIRVNSTCIHCYCYRLEHQLIRPSPSKKKS